jgi:hypothetical protein
MSYAVVVLPEAIQALEKIPPEHFDQIEKELEYLGKKHMAVSRKAGFPYPQIGQQYAFQIQGSESRYYVTALFFFSQDEKEIRIFGFSVTQV